MADKMAGKNAKKYYCDCCDFVASKLSNFKSHLLTPKHSKADKMLTNTDVLAGKNAVGNNYTCNCGKKYKHRQSLFKHKTKCEELNSNNVDTDINNNNITKITSSLVLEILKQNKELTIKNLELTDKIIKTNNNTITNSNNINNSHNKTFNLNLFLNETCKDAMNITDFVDSIQLQLSDLENVGRLGYVNGISKIIIKNLNALDETKRPIHCTDTKREILYVKDEDIWKKDNDNDKKCVKKAIKRIAYKNCKLIPEFREKHPDCNKSDSMYSDQYNKMIVEAMGGSGNNDEEKEYKIIQNISKEVQINKREQLVL